MRPFGSRVLITGGSRGIGLAYAEALASAGCDAALLHWRDGLRVGTACDRLMRVTGRRLHAIECDVSDPSSARGAVARAIEVLGGLDIAICNAGICEFRSFLELSDADWRRHVGVNLDGGFFVGQQAARHLVAAHNGGRIIFTTSVGAYRSNPTQTHYCATKGALHLLAQGMALELGPHRITVNAIAPGWISTDINEAQSSDPAIVQPWLKSKCALGRLGAPDDLKAAILFLASAEAGYVTGTTVTVDGGWNAQL